MIAAARRLVAVVGATATGKSDVAAAIAEAGGGEVVGADAYQVYAGLDAGTAKPSRDLRARVPHHLIDAATPERPLTLATYLDLARAALEDIWARGRLPVVAGGSGQYVWALLEGWSVPRVAPNLEARRRLEDLAAARGAAALHSLLAEHDPQAAARLDPSNVRRVVRTLEVVLSTRRPLSTCRTRTPLDADVFVLGLHCDRAGLSRRIDARVAAMFASGLVEEIEALRRRGLGECRPVRAAIGYREVSAYLDGEMSLADAQERTKTATHRLARNQGSWFKAADPRIHWVDAGPDAAGECLAAVRAWLAAPSAAADA